MANNKDLLPAYKYSDGSFNHLFMSLPGRKLTNRHRQIIPYLQERISGTGKIPTITGNRNAKDLNIGVLEYGFPEWYYRRAVKITGWQRR